MFVLMLLIAVSPEACVPKPVWSGDPVLVSVEDMDGNGVVDVVISGSDPATLVITDDPASARLLIASDVSSTFDAPAVGAALHEVIYGPIDVIAVTRGDAVDEVCYRMAPGIQLCRRSLFVDLAGGADSFTWDVSGADLVAGSELLVDVDGGSGRDRCELTLGDLIGVRVSVVLDMGHHDDEVLLTAEGTMDAGASFDLNAELGAGDDRATMYLDVDLAATGSGRIDLSLSGREGDDFAELTWLGSVGVGGDGRYLADLERGDDVANLFLGDVSELDGRLKVDANGGDGDDLLAIGRTGASSSLILAGQLSTRLSGDGGDDVLSLDLGAVGGDVSGDEARWSGRMDGGVGNDSLELACHAGVSARVHYDLHLDGGRGMDSFRVDQSDTSGHETFGPAPAVIVDGGPGEDALTVIAALALGVREVEVKP